MGDGWCDVVKSIGRMGGAKIVLENYWHDGKCFCNQWIDDSVRQYLTNWQPPDFNGDEEFIKQAILQKIYPTSPLEGLGPLTDEQTHQLLPLIKYGVGFARMAIR